MRSMIAPPRFRLFSLALGALLTAVSAPPPAAAQTASDREKAALSEARLAPNRKVGTRGRLSSVYWTETSEQALYDMKLVQAARRLAIDPAVRAHTKIWTARADICDLTGDEILIQVRSPLTCGSLGCEMIIASEAGGVPRVLMRTIGDSIDAPSRDAVTINQGAKTERSWRYEGARYNLSRRPN